LGATQNGAGYTETMASVYANFPAYNGHVVFIDQLTSFAGAVARVTCTVEWEFKDPNALYLAPPPGGGPLVSNIPQEYVTPNGPTGSTGPAL